MPSLSSQGQEESRLVGFTLATMAWWKGPDALMMTTQQQAGKLQSISRTPFPATASRKSSKKSGGSPPLTGTGTISATTAGGIVGRKIIMGQQGNNANG
jgi:hypothetical protein